MLTSRITLPTPSAPSQEDIFSSALSALFTDDIQNSHGSPGGSLIYTSPSFGDITLHIPAHPDVEEERKLFAHYLWNASLVAAEGIEMASVAVAAGLSKDGNGTSGEGEQWNPRWWNVRGKRVLELGAVTNVKQLADLLPTSLVSIGTALPSIISAFSHASSVTITDHPSSPALLTGAIEANVADNLSKGDARARVCVRGYAWGTETMSSVEGYGRPAAKLGRYDVIVLADCLWVPSQHVNLAKTIARGLSAAPDSCAIVVAGFHTGRGIVRDFFDLAMCQADDGRGGSQDEDDSTRTDEDENGKRQASLEIEEIYEIDVDGQRRPWQNARPGEGKEESKKWCVVAILVPRRRGEDEQKSGEG